MGMKIGLIDVDNEYRGKVTFPNLSLMKLSAWHKAQGDEVMWYSIDKGHFDKVYMTKVFGDEYTPEYPGLVFADEIVRGGSGYAIRIENGREVYHKEFDLPLSDEIEHIFPDYSLYGIDDRAYGFLTRGCPRGCDFCHIAGMQGRISHTVARLSEFWNGQRYISLLDPNIVACPDWRIHLQDLIDSGAKIDFNQGLDVRFLTDDKIEMLNQIKYDKIHFAWDRPEEDLRETLTRVRKNLRKCSKSNTSVYILVNSGSSFEEDVARVEFVKSLKMQPYVMVYRGATITPELKRLKRYANNPYVCWATPTFADYVPSARSDRFGKSGMTHKAVNSIESIRSKDEKPCCRAVTVEPEDVMK